jgi:hypothetical protein
MTNTCKYCNKSFAKESTLAVHLCEQKKRHNEQSERGVQVGFQAYIRFYEYTQGSSKSKTFTDFAKSPYYKAFSKFGRYCVNTRVINPARFTEWVVGKNKKLDYWASDALYTEYLVEYLRVENVTDALARAVEFGMDWSEKTTHPPQDCLRYGNTNAMVYAVTTGRVSAWVIYNCESGQKFLSELTSEQIAIVWPYIDTDYWQKRFKERVEDQEFARDILQKAGW